MSSVDDPEKHFLGNLLEDDTSASSFAENATSATASVLSQLQSVGPVMRPVTDASVMNAWPEPPPPYSPRLEASELSSNINTTLCGSTQAPAAASWYPFSDRKETSAFDLLASLGAHSSATLSVPPHAPASSQFQHVSYHHHHHTHNVQVQNHYFPAPPPGLEAFGPRPTTTTTTTTTAPPPPQSAIPNSSTLYDTISPQLWDYTGLANISTDSNSVLFSDWKKENMSQTTPQTATSSDSSLSLKSLGKEEEERNSPLSPKEVVKLARGKKQLAKSYADHLSKSAATTPKKGIPIGSEKKQKQELAKKNSQTLGETSRIIVKEQPHSAPVVSKMPFSYRDVAARVENSSNSNHSLHHSDELPSVNHERKDTSSLSSNSSETKIVATKSSGLFSVKASGGSRRSDSNRRSRSDNDHTFQKISKNKKVNKSNVVVAPIVYETVHPVDASSRFDALKNLDSISTQQNVKKSSNGRPPLIQEVFSRSSSPVDCLEDTEGEDVLRARSASNCIQPNVNNQVKKEQKKRGAVHTNQQRRRKSRKVEPTWWYTAMNTVVDFAALVWSYVYHILQWTFELIVDVCSKIHDLCINFGESVYCGAWKGFRKLCLAIVCCLFALVCYFRKGAFILRSLNLKNENDEKKELDWGCKRELPIPTNANEYVDRLSRETIRDAYSVFGLKCDCSDDEIKRNYKRIAALVSPDKCCMESAEDVFFLVNIAFEAIGNSTARYNYTADRAATSETHLKVLRSWEEMVTHYEEVRNTLFCDCTKRHYRVRTTIQPAQARYCKKCAIKHPAKQNDIWVEKRNLGLTTVYLTCAENVVYDITEWATCEVGAIGKN
uniref:J domain-containing protein n=1 Tax=Caenorhabditis japonica TaxID=281687 RepID=A0A8R1I071_CAEJA